MSTSNNIDRKLFAFQQFTMYARGPRSQEELEDWLRQALEEMYEAGRKEHDDNCPMERAQEYFDKARIEGEAAMKKRVMEMLEDQYTFSEGDSAERAGAYIRNQIIAAAIKAIEAL